MKTMKGYQNMYLRCDILLLADVFARLRNNGLKNYGLCPSHYLSTSALNWDPIFKMTKVKLEFIPDPDMYLFFEKSMKGEVSYISKRNSKANNKHLKSNDPKQQSKHIIYLDMNNIHGYSMSKFLLTSGFKTIDPKEFELNKYTRISSKGCVLEVCLECHKKLFEYIMIIF